MDLLPLRKGIFPQLGANNDETDVTVTKRALDRLGYHRSGANGPSCFADQKFLDSIRTFQKDRGLNVDAVILPGGPTRLAINKLLQGMFTESVDEPGPDDRPTDEQCDDLYYNIDIPTCNGISRSRGKRAGEICRHSAAERYAACLAGRPRSKLPPLTWVNY